LRHDDEERESAVDVGQEHEERKKEGGRMGGRVFVRTRGWGGFEELCECE